MREERISIIVPVYNVASYLDRCIQSLRRQSYQALEIVLVDDGSTDESGSMCDWYGEDDKRIHIIHKENGGLMSAWKAGVRESSGSYLCFIDSDDWVEPGMIQEMAERLLLTEGEMVCCNHVINKAHEEWRVTQGLAPGVYEGSQLKELFRELLGKEHRKITLSRCMKLISRELIVNNLSLCNEKLRMGEDVNIMLPALLDSKRVVVMEEGYYYHYFYNTSSMVHAYDQGLYKNIKLLQEVMTEVFREKVRQNGLPVSEEEIERQCKQEYVFLLMLALKNEARGNRRGNSYLKHIRIICKKEDTPELIRRYPVKIKEKANRLLYLVMKYPSGWTIRGLRLAMKIFYRRLQG